MRIEDVPQDPALFDGHHGVAYAVDETGRYVLAPTVGWDVVNRANIVAWHVIAEEIETTLRKVRSGAASPLLFHMVRHQMDVSLLASYMGVARWRVRRHLKPRAYARLAPQQRSRYAQLFQIPVEALDYYPERVELPVDLCVLGRNQD